MVHARQHCTLWNKRPQALVRFIDKHAELDIIQPGVNNDNSVVKSCGLTHGESPALTDGLHELLQGCRLFRVLCCALQGAHHLVELLWCCHQHHHQLVQLVL